MGINDLQYAIINKHVIAFTYYNSDLQKSRRRIEPLRWCLSPTHGILLGFAKASRTYGCFRLSRMRHIKVLCEVFERTLPLAILSHLTVRKDHSIPAF